MKFDLSNRLRLSLIAAFAIGSVGLITPMSASFAQQGGNVPIAAPVALQGDDGSRPAPPSIGAAVPLSYFGPAPSGALNDPKANALVGPKQLLRSGTVNEDGTITLPLYRGKMRDGTLVWYILTDTTDQGNADALGLNWAPKMAYAGAGGPAVRLGRLEKDLTLTFGAGGVDFRPARTLVPGDAPKPFPPKQALPGSVGDANYTPLVRIENAGGHIYNAPVVAYGTDAAQLNFCNGNVDYTRVHDRVTKICPEGQAGGTVTLQTTPIFSFAKPATYISMDASDPMVATLDNGTFAPAMANLQIGFDDGAFSAVERLFVIANGPTGSDNPQRQGLFSALSDKDAQGKGLPPINLIGGIPTVALDYSPLWDLNLGEWTPNAIAKGYRSRMIDEFQYLGMVQLGHITGPGGKPFGSTGIIVNCPIIMRFL
ncbi:MAG: hypothetical protein ABIO92_00100 [Chloroflexia bacterium]